MWNLFVQWLIRRAQRTPYYHLNGYMLRWWLVPYSYEMRRDVKKRTDMPLLPWVIETRTDGTGPVSLWRRPIAWLFQRFDIAMRVHEILRSDSDPNPHDHPWPYLTVILAGGYWERRYSETGHLLSTVWHGPGSVLYRPAHWWHRLELPAGQTCTTLFITRRYVHGWGFNVNGKKVPWREYLNGAPVRPSAATPSAAPGTAPGTPVPPARAGQSGP